MSNKMKKVDNSSEKKILGRGGDINRSIGHSESKSSHEGGRGRGYSARGSYGYDNESRSHRDGCGYAGRGRGRGRGRGMQNSGFSNDHDDDETGPQRQKSIMQISYHVKNYLEGNDTSPISCERFLQGLVDDRYDASYQLILVTKDEESLSKFRRCFFNLESKIQFYRLLKFFCDPKLSFGASKLCVTQCCEEIYLSRYLRRLNMTNEDFQENNMVLLAWFLLKIMSNVAEARSDDSIRQLATQLEAVNPDLRHFLSSPKIDSAHNISLFQKQHDNDYPFDFRLVEIIPSADELQSRCDMVNLISERLTNLYPTPSVARLIDCQFRFLRENWVQTLKEEYYSERSKPDFFNSRRIYELPRFVRFNASKYGDKLYAEVLLTPNTVISSLLKQQGKDLKDYLYSKAGSRILPINSSVFLLDATGGVVAIGTIISRDIDEAFLESFTKNNTAKIGLTFPSRVWRQILQRSRHEHSRHEDDGTFPICNYLYSSSVVSFVSPILAHLKTMTTIPFHEEIVEGHQSLPLPDQLDFAQLQEQVDANDADSSQLNALQQTCLNRFSLIQGPPGTGKTYIGVQLAKFLLNARCGHKVLTLSYTNHALDSFMESILDYTNGKFESSIKRLGRSQKTSTRMKQHAIGNTKFSYHQLMCSRELKEQLEHHLSEFKKIMSDILMSRSWNARSWNFVKYYLQYYGDRGILDQFSMPKDLSIAGRNGKALRDQDIFRSWYYGDPRPHWMSHQPRDSVWDLSKQERMTAVEQWNNEYFNILLTDFLNLLNTTERIATNLSQLSNAPKLQEVAEARLLGATTSSACLSSDLIAQFGPTVLIIEEAAEILEAHIVVNIPPSVKHVILIGDHKQLRPKVDLYSLQKVSNRGINFDVSLFERLACNSNFQLATLGVQHRMRPEFSEIIRRSTYPELEDHSSTHGRSNILGLQSNLIFIDHHNCEKSSSDILEKVAKVNEFEANMVVETIIYLLLQGYETDDIVVLTPYLGQLFRLHELFSKCHLKARISKMDAEDLNTNGFDDLESEPASSSTGTLREVRVATVDNFQGEESKIIICSLVRCNDEGNIGFLYEPERLNVLCSRARDGFIVYGSLTTVMKSKGAETWAPLIKYLRETGNIFSGLPTKCQRHQTLNLISTPDEFKSKSPDGGCCKPCEEVIITCTAAVKHTCWRKCHADIASHKSLCRAQVEVFCVNGHNLSRTCGLQEIPPCTQMINVPCSRGVHQVKMKCGANKIPNCSKNFKTQCPNSHNIAVRCCVEDADFSAHCSICKEGEKMLHDPALEEELKSKQLELESVQLQAEKSKAEFHHKKNIKEIDHQIEASQKQIAMYKDEYWNVDRTERHKSSPLSDNQIDTTAKSLSPTSTLASGARPQQNPDKISTKIAESKNEIDRVAKSLSQSTIHESPCHDKKVQPALRPSPRLDHNFQEVMPKVVEVPIASSTRGSSSPPLLPSENIPSQTQNEHISQLLALVGLATGEDMWMELYLECENYTYASPLEREAVTGLKMFAQWKLEFSAHPYREFEYQVMNDHLISELDHLCAGIINYLHFVFNRVNPNIKGESLLLYGWECRTMQSLEYDVLNPWKADINTFLKSVKKEGLENVAMKNTKSKKYLPRKETAIDKWNLCIKNYRESNQKTEDGKSTPSPAVDSLMKMIGLESVKNEFVTLYNHILISNARGGGHSNSYNIRFEGNPGTGKTTVARHYANFLKEVNIIPSECELLETSGSKLIIDGPRELQKQLEEMKENGGCVVFVDEAYQLEPSTNQQGAQVLNYIIPLAERLEGEFGKVVWIFAGYVNDMEKLFNFNPGLSSRFPTRFVFEDYTNDELETIFRHYLKNEPPETQEKKKAKNSKEKRDSSKAQNNQRNPSASMYGNAFRVFDGETRTDQWGNTWTLNSINNRWTDEYGNINAYGPQSSSISMSYDRSMKLGSTRSPIINEKTGITWAFDEVKGHWFDMNDQSNIRNSYPGKPVTPKRTQRVVTVPFHVDDDKWIRIAIRRVASRRMIKGFGNARDVRLLFDKCIQRQSDRISRLQRDNPLMPLDLHLLLRDDILGPKASKSILKNCPEYHQLLRMDGLTKMKEEIEQILNMVIQNAEREDREEPLFNISLNRIFYGNPGTGKTTVAKLYGKILCCLGILSKGDTILKNPSDFVGSVIGGSEAATRAILSAAEGCVLVIDEAYMLNPTRSSGLNSGGGDPYKTAVLDTLVEQVQGVPGDDRVVLLLGYKKEMEEMFRNCNPGLARRFQFDNPIVFEDYNDTSLLKILRSKVLECGLTIDMKTAMFAIQQLSKKRSLPNFGNAGEINNMLNDAKKYVARRGDKALRQEDFCKDGQLPVRGLEDNVMNELIGNDDIDELIADYKNLVEFAERQRCNVKEIIDYNFLFVGSPGTGVMMIYNCCNIMIGKTTVARKMGAVFYHLGLLPSSDVVDISAKDLVTGYVGQAGKKTAETLHNCRGKVLFIDEAYQLNPAKGGPYMQEVVDEIVRALTSEEIKGNMVLILAGYESDIEEMLTVNQGLRSRISKKIHFPDFNCDKICQMLKSLLKKNSFALSNEALALLPEVAESLRLQPGFSNGRDIENLTKRIMANALRAKNPQSQVSDTVLLNTFNDLISELQRSAGFGKSIPSIPSLVPLQMKPAYAHQSPPPPPVTATAQRIATKTLEATSPSPPSEPENIDDSFLQTMQRLMDERGLNSKEGVKRLLSFSDDEFDDLVGELAQRLGIDVETVKSMLREWQGKQRNMLATLEDAERELEEMKKTKKRGLVPIWRCGVCGRADQPYIACYVQPYVVRYEERELQ